MTTYSSSATTRSAVPLDEYAQELLVAAGHDMGVPLSDAQVNDFAHYLEALLRWQRKINLTSLTEPTDIILKHFIDSLTIVPHVKMGAFVMDIGSGAGFPGLPLKIARPDVRILLLDSAGKKVAFLNDVIRRLGLKHCRAVQQRAEDKAFQDIMSRKVDVAVSRATCALATLLMAAAPYLAPGGKCIAMRGPTSDAAHDSLDASQLAQLRFTRPQTETLSLPRGAGDRRLVIFTSR